MCPQGQGQQIYGVSVGGEDSGDSRGLFKRGFRCFPKDPLDHQTCPLETMTQFNAPLPLSYADLVSERNVDTRDEPTCI